MGKYGRQPPGGHKVEPIESRKPGAARGTYEPEQIQRPAARQVPERPAERARPDQFRLGSRLPHYLSAVGKRIGSGYRSFRLPGTNYVVSDQRGRGAEEAEAFKRGTEYQMKEGQLVGAKEKAYINYLGERQVMQPEAAKAAAREISRLLSEFEKMLIERFEKGKTIEQKSEDGRPNFLAKTADQWRSFFSKFLSRTAWRKAELKMLKEFIFRGLTSLKKGDGKFAMLIGDMTMADGQIQKFARLKVLTQLMEMLANLKPGSNLEAELLRKGLGAEEFRYLALIHKHGERAIKTGMEPTKGMFGQLKTEDEVARQLGLRRRKRGGKGYGGPIKWGAEGEEVGKHAFVPWGFWERETRGLWPKMATAIIATIITLLILAGIYALVKYSTW